MLYRGIPWNVPLVTCISSYAENTSDAWHIPRYPTRKHCITSMYIPLIGRVRGLYGKLWTEFFPSFYGPSAKRAGHENKEGKNEDP